MRNKTSLVFPKLGCGDLGRTEAFTGHKGKKEPFLQTCLSLFQEASACPPSQLLHQNSQVTAEWSPPFSLISLQLDIIPWNAVHLTFRRYAAFPYYILSARILLSFILDSFPTVLPYSPMMISSTPRLQYHLQRTNIQTVLCSLEQWFMELLQSVLKSKCTPSTGYRAKKMPLSHVSFANKSKWTLCDLIK